MDNKKKRRISNILLGLLVTIIFSGFVYDSTKELLKDVFKEKHSGYEKMQYLSGKDPEGDSVIFRIVEVFPEHDFKLEVDPNNHNAVTLLMNRADIKYDTYRVKIFYGDRKEDGKIKGSIKTYTIKDIKYK